MTVRARSRAWILTALPAALIAAGIANPAAAQNPEFFPPPSGWTAAATSQGWLVQSPAYTEGTISFVMPVAATLSGDFVQSFATEVPDMVANAFGDVTASSAVQTITKMLGPDPVLKSTHVVRRDDGAEARIEVIGYPVTEGAQLMFVISAMTIGLNSTPMTVIHDFALNIRTQNFALTEDRLARALAYQNGSGDSAGSDGTDTASTTPPSGPDKCRIERRLVDTSRYEQYNCRLYSGSFIPICDTRYIPGMENRDEYVCD